MLYIVSTPIGNLKDITFRAVETLQQVDIIAAEDTRHSKILLDHYNIQKPLLSYFEHNQVKRGEEIIKLLKDGKNVALVTDAGTPGISDPGFHLIRLAQENEIPIYVIPGATALITALSASGLPAHAFIFEGFLPVKSAARRKKLGGFKDERRTVIFYESPHRIVSALEDIKDVLSDPVVVVARELTKKFEEIKKGKASVLLAHFEKSKPKGEIVLLFNLTVEK
ncbi:MAG: 16S rRNA (cytidine(1402)-2'-O)-methyltransferase [Candidatus Omnitrophota bacterium]